MNSSDCLRMLTITGSVGLAFLAMVQGAAAGMTQWAENEGGRMRIIALPPQKDGTVEGALQIEPRTGWITYWKEPGQAGIPPKITLPPGHGIVLQDFRFPVPRSFEADGVRDLGYDHPVTLPFTLKVEDVDGPLTLNASAFIGLCRNVCIPFQADFALDLRNSRGLPLEENMILDAATRQLPERPSDTFKVAEHRLATDGSRLELALRLPQDGAKPTVYVAGPEGHVLFDQENARHADGLYRVDMPVGKLPKGYEPKGKAWDVLVVVGERAMETSLAFE